MAKQGKVEYPSKWSKLFVEKNPDSPTKGRWEQMGNFLRPHNGAVVDLKNVSDAFIHG